ncbi:MAG: alpha-L-rhamnosidase C-terminal domain-containing protein [Bacteroidota bacterium]|jgi:alpha-L-rhamnosidase
MRKLLTLLFLISCLLSNAQTAINPHLLKGSWRASWITCPNVPQRDYGVYHFRKNFSIDTLQEKFIVHVSADNRYRLFVNGTAVCSGPARGDLYNWYFESIDIAPYLRKGSNTIAALVWNMGVHAPVAQISNQTAFVLQGDGEKEKIINTDKTWKVLRDSSYLPCSLDNGARVKSYMVVGPGDQVDASKYPWGWETYAYNDDAWEKAISIGNPVNVGYGSDNLWSLQTRNIPLMFERLQRISTVRRSDGMEVGSDFLAGNQPLIIPANRKVTILLDQSYNTVAYPQLIVSKGKHASIKLSYTEALLVDTNSAKYKGVNVNGPQRRKDFQKGNRNDVDSKLVIGNYDIFIADGGENRMFRPLWFRTYRYMQVDITTKDEPLAINDLYGMATGYPFEVMASFKSNDSSLQQIWDIGWRTAQLCAGETYFDCPYYEQLQYEGDTRIQSLISIYVTGDDRLMRKAILDFYHSRVPEGLTQGRYPSSRLQVIPPFSLYWISMLHDYWMHRNDFKFVEQFLMPVAGVLDWYEKKIDQQKNMLGPMKWWNFVDWNQKFPGGTPDGANDGNSSVITFQYIYTLKQAAELFSFFGKTNEANHYRLLAEQLGKSTFASCFDSKKSVIANTPLKNTFSQHANIIAILSGSVPPALQQKIMMNTLTDTSLSQATFYYRFYLNRALNYTGNANQYYKELQPWRDMIDLGLTTFAEEPDPTRSDCHAWSSSPNYDFFATICGITPSKPGFAAVRIAPALGELTHVVGTMPHPAGMIKVEIQKKDSSGVLADITLPENVPGTFFWKGKTVPLRSGHQQIKL